MPYMNPNSMQIPQLPTTTANTAAGPGGLKLDDLSDAELDEWLKQSTQDYEGEAGVLAGQMSTAEALRDTATPEGRQTGRVYTAANPLEHIGRAANQYVGKQQVGSTQDALRKLGTDKQSGLSTAIRGMLGR